MRLARCRTDAFSAAWNAELAELPEYETSTMHMVAGLLLPIWKQLPNESTHVYRLQTDDGERIIGRRVSPAWVATVSGDEAQVPSPGEAWAMLLAGDAELHLAEGQALRRVRSSRNGERETPDLPVRCGQEDGHAVRLLREAARGGERIQHRAPRLEVEDARLGQAT